MPVRSLLLLVVCRAVLSAAVGQVIFSGPVTPQQNPQSTGKTYPVSGTVFNTVTSEPIGRALVNVNGNGGQKVAFTGADGRFQIDNVPEGTITLSAQRPGYFSPETSPAGGGFQGGYRPQQVGPGSNDFRVGLTPLAKLVGKVVDPDGEPVSDVQVQLVAQQISQGRKQWVMRGAASTDDLGEFRLGDQFPGLLKLCTAAKPETPMALHNAWSYPPRCYPNSPDQKSAQAIDLQPGGEFRADITLGVVPGFTVSGRVVGAPAGTGTGLWLSAENGTQGNFMFEMNPKTGQFVFRDVPGGMWSLHATTNDQDRMVTTQQELTVHGADVGGVELRLQPGADIRVMTEQPGAVGFAPVQLRLERTDAENLGFNGNATDYFSSPLANANGENGNPAVAIRGVQPGQYKVFVQSNGGNSCVGTVTEGSSDLLRDPLTVSAGNGASPIVISMRSDCASLSATVHGGPANASLTVLAVPDDGAVDPQTYSTQTDTQGNLSFTISNLRPGNYHVYAVPDANSLEYMNPNAMAGFPAQTISLGANQKASITFDLGGRGIQ